MVIHPNSLSSPQLTLRLGSPFHPAPQCTVRSSVPLTHSAPSATVWPLHFGSSPSLTTFKRAFAHLDPDPALPAYLDGV